MVGGHEMLVTLNVAENTCCNSTATLRSDSGMPRARRLSQARSVHLEAHTPQMAVHAWLHWELPASHSPRLITPLSSAAAATCKLNARYVKSQSMSGVLALLQCLKILLVTQEGIEHKVDQCWSSRYAIATATVEQCLTSARSPSAGCKWLVMASRTAVSAETSPGFKSLSMSAANCPLAGSFNRRSNVPKGRATPPGTAKPSGSFRRSSANFRDLPPTRPGWKSCSRSTQRSEPRVGVTDTRRWESLDGCRPAACEKSRGVIPGCF